MLVSIHQTTRCHILEDRGLNACLPKYLKNRRRWQDIIKMGLTGVVLGYGLN